MSPLAAVAALAAALLPAPPAAPLKLDDLVARHIEAVGGAARLRALKSVRLTGVTILTDAAETHEGTFLIETKRPNKARTEMVVGDVHMVEVFDGRAGWTTDVETGAFKPTPAEELAELRVDSEFDDWLLDFKERGVKVEDLGPGKVGSGDTRKLKLTYQGQAVHLYLDERSYLEVRRDTLDAGGDPIDSTLTTYTTVEGLKMPATMTITYDEKPGGVKLRIDKAEIDPEIPDARFAPPR